MKPIVLITVLVIFCIACSEVKSPDSLKQEIFQTEKAFEKMTTEKGIAEAFYFYADDSAVIKREHDTLITGKENIRNYYVKRNNPNATVTWTPDFIDVSESGDLAYTYGRYTWKVVSDSGDTALFKGIFHTVWKRQNDESWRYVWD
jgi:ketosteroid isomerase-like protein